MGCVSGMNCKNNKPVNEVDIHHPFAMSVYEVTRGEFRRFIEQTGYVTDGERWDIAHLVGEQISPQKWPRVGRSGHCLGFSSEDGRVVTGYTNGGLRVLTWRRPGFEQTDNHPVVCISFSDATEYVRWLAKETDRPYRLPSEAEWEYSARAGPLEKYFDPMLLCSEDNLESCHGATQPVGRDGPNGFGLYDIGSSVVEWTADCWNPDYIGAPDDGSAWMKGDCSARVTRDFAVPHGPRAPGTFPRHEIRVSQTTNQTMNYIGFRVAKSPTY